MLSNTTKLKGLYTFGNELLQPEGSLFIADNVNIDEPNVVTQRRGFNDYADMLATESLRIRQLLDYKNTPIRHYNDKLEFHRNGVFEQFDGSYYELDTDIRIKSVPANGNLYFTTSEGIKKISALNASEFSVAAGYITNAGVPEALDISGKIVYTSSGFLPPLSKVAYKVLFGKKDVNTNLLLGTPSARYVVINASQDVFTYEKTNLVFKLDENFLAQKTTVTCGNKNNTNETNGTNPDSILLVNSANDDFKYAFWFNKGTGVAPTVIGYTNVEVDISALGVSDNVAPALYSAAQAALLEDITTILVGTTVIFTNEKEGASTGVTSPNANLLTDIGGGWSKVDNVVGVDSKYVEKYFIVNTQTTEYCFYYGNSRTIGEIPDDPALLGMTFIGIEISNNSNKAFIANKTSQLLRTNVGSQYNINLDVSVVNPIVTLTDTAGGDMEDVQQGTIPTTSMEVVVLNQGTIAEGQFANVEVSFTIPSGIDTSYFYQIYRTSYISVTQGLTLNDIDPGEEHNLVYEGSVNQAVGTKITVLDITNENFRNSGLPLYNNPISGEGILQSNSIPPVAKDVTNYRGYTFYGNTKISHQQAITTVSVDSIVSGTSKFIVVSDDVTREYTFRGTASNYTLTTADRANTKIHNLANPDSKIYLYSALNETKYVLYFDDGTGIKATDTDAVHIIVDISDLAPTDSVAPTLQLILGQFPDFTVTRLVNVLTIENSENGDSNPISTPNGIVTDIGVGWSLVVNSIGLGEDLVNQLVLISKSASVGLKLERTIRSLVNVINADILSPVNAYYVSSLTDLPGKFLLKARSIEDQYFYSIVQNILGSDFNPELPTKSVNPFTAIAAVGTTKTNLTLTAHGFTNGESVYISVPNAVPTIDGVFVVTVIDVNTIQIDAPHVSGNTTGSFYFFPFEKSDNLKSPNRIYFSKFNQPEAVPLVNYIDIGTKDEPIERILSLRDYLFIMKTDGIYMLSGENGIFTVRMLDTEKILCPDSAVVLNNQIYLLSTSGVVTVNENSPMIIARMIENKFQILNLFRANVRRLGFGVSYTDDRAYLLWIPTDSVDEVSTQAFRYNILEKMWTRWTKSATCGLVIGNNQPLMYIGDGVRPIVMQERKNLDRTDFADKNFTVTMGLDSFVSNRYRLSDVSEIQVGDVIIQSQSVNTSEYHRLLQKLDLDTGLLFDSFYVDYFCNVGENLASKLTDLNIKLVELDTSGTVTLQDFQNTDWVEMQQLYNILIGQLNNIVTVTVFKNYAQSTGSINFEHIISVVYPKSSEVQTFDETEFIQGELIIYKHINSQCQTNPIHFGNPSSFKQINKGYLLFDQNNFFRMKLEYSTDLSPSFEGMIFRGRGIGFWGSTTWGFEDKNYWGGDGNDAPRRVILPRNKQRCRYVTVKFTHAIARDMYRIVGVAHDVREFSARAYK